MKSFLRQKTYSFVTHQAFFSKENRLVFNIDNDSNKENTNAPQESSSDPKIKDTDQQIQNLEETKIKIEGLIIDVQQKFSAWTGKLDQIKELQKEITELEQDSNEKEAIHVKQSEILEMIQTAEAEKKLFYEKLEEISKNQKELDPQTVTLIDLLNELKNQNTQNVTTAPETSEPISEFSTAEAPVEGENTEEDTSVITENTEIEMPPEDEMVSIEVTQVLGHKPSNETQNRLLEEIKAEQNRVRKPFLNRAAIGAYQILLIQSFLEKDSHEIKWEDKLSEEGPYGKDGKMIPLADAFDAKFYNIVQRKAFKSLTYFAPKDLLQSLGIKKNLPNLLKRFQIDAKSLQEAFVQAYIQQLDDIFIFQHTPDSIKHSYDTLITQNKILQSDRFKDYLEHAIENTPKIETLIKASQVQFDDNYENHFFSEILETLKKAYEQDAHVFDSILPVANIKKIKTSDNIYGALRSENRGAQKVVIKKLIADNLQNYTQEQFIHDVEQEKQNRIRHKVDALTKAQLFDISENVEKMVKTNPSKLVRQLIEKVIQGKMTTQTFLCEVFDLVHGKLTTNIASTGVGEITVTSHPELNPIDPKDRTKVNILEMKENMHFEHKIEKVYAFIQPLFPKAIKKLSSQIFHRAFHKNRNREKSLNSLLEQTTIDEAYNELISSNTFRKLILGQLAKYFSPNSLSDVDTIAKHLNTEYSIPKPTFMEALEDCANTIAHTILSKEEFQTLWETAAANLPQQKTR